ncbi:MAG: exodeoxyribonuclease VII large subunit [Phycisphaerales bacterium]|nr:exodeoxyribonuclease VII large subunit [Phycisphaerales bacterium]
MTSLPSDYGLTPDAEAIGVSELSRRIEAALSSGLPSKIRVEGEIANASERNGHRYFSLREPDASIGCVMWASDARRSNVVPVDGDRVIATGQVVHWAPGGRTQLRVRSIEPVGEGALLATFRARCEQLRDAGWFDPEHKAPLPACPRCIAVLTSASGAAITDVVRTASDRFPACKLVLIDVPVQGATAAPRIARAIAGVDKAAASMGIDAIVLTRGGGSLEDLWAFNEMSVAQAIHACHIPLVAAIGHESDVTIAELVADARASTPTRAAVMLVPDRVEAAQRLDMTNRALLRAMHTTLMHCQDAAAQAAGEMVRVVAADIDGRRQLLGQCQQRLERARPDLVLARRQQALASLGRRLAVGARRQLDGARGRLGPLQLTRLVRQYVERAQASASLLDRALAAVDPAAVLERGFSLTTSETGDILRHPDQVDSGALLQTRLAGGTIRSRVERD